VLDDRATSVLLQGTLRASHFETTPQSLCNDIGHICLFSR
jgi:hypothetical protein